MRGAAVALTVAAALVVGGIWFPRDADPGRADAAGYHLNTLAGPTGSAINDWSPSGAVHMKTVPRGLLVITGGGTIQILTRPLAVFAHRCYAASVVARTTGPNRLALAVMDVDAQNVLASKTLAKGGPSETKVAVSSGSRHRLTLAIFGNGRMRLLLEQSALVPTQTC